MNCLTRNSDSKGRPPDGDEELFTENLKRTSQQCQDCVPTDGALILDSSKIGIAVRRDPVKNVTPQKE